VRNLKIAAAVLVVVAVVVLQRLGVLDVFSSPGELKRTLVNLGPWGHLAFVASYTALQPFALPGTLFIMVAPLVWPWPLAFALSMTGTMGASIVGFAFARFVGRDWVRDKIPERIKKYERALERRAFSTVALLRLILWMPQWLHAFFGMSKISFWTHFWGSVVGYALPVFLVSYFGEKLFALMKDAPIEVWVALGAGLVAIAVAVWLATRARASRAQPRCSTRSSARWRRRASCRCW
jgi:uncharacterized membrane protein YdjX (TVP38/TMEM64 family)